MDEELPIEIEKEKGAIRGSKNLRSTVSAMSGTSKVGGYVGHSLGPTSGQQVFTQRPLGLAW
jgi:hypothetical protein